jgi:hypothetical protein
MRSEFQTRLRSVRRRSVANVDSVERNWVCPVESVSFVRKTAVVCCIVRCIESRRVEVGVEPEELRNVSISAMESRPMFSGAGWCGAEGEWLEETWWAEARP